jgi:hypothetical protein
MCEVFRELSHRINWRELSTSRADLTDATDTAWHDPGQRSDPGTRQPLESHQVNCRDFHKLRQTDWRDSKGID